MENLGTLYSYFNPEDKNAGKSILIGKVVSIAHFGIVRDYTVTLKSGDYIVIPAKTVRAIVGHENEEMGTTELEEKKLECVRSQQFEKAEGIQIAIDTLKK